MSIKKTKADKVLVTVAESVGSALGSLAAKATKAKKVLLSAKSTERRTKRRIRTALRRASKQTNKAEKRTLKTGRNIIGRAGKGRTRFSR